jgi:TfoX/Sxy family transcriptional regulator of competence genes
LKDQKNGDFNWSENDSFLIKGANSPMAFNEVLATRIRQALTRKRGIEEKKMFGGVGFLLNGNLLVGVWKDSMIVRVGPDQSDQALSEPHVRAFDITGKPMKGWVLVEQDGIAEDDELQHWIERAQRFVKTLEAK